MVSKDSIGKKKVKAVPFKARGEPVVVSVPLSQVTLLLCNFFLSRLRSPLQCYTHSYVAYPPRILLSMILFIFLYYHGQIKSLSSAIMNIPKDLLQVEARENALKKVSELLSRHPDGIPLDPEVDMKVY